MWKKYDTWLLLYDNTKCEFIYAQIPKIRENNISMQKAVPYSNTENKIKSISQRIYWIIDTLLHCQNIIWFEIKAANLNWRELCHSKISSGEIVYAYSAGWRKRD